MLWQKPMPLGVLVGMRIKEQGTRSEERGMGKMEDIREMEENG